MATAFVDSMIDELGSDGSLPDVVPFQRFGNRPSDDSWNAALLSLLYSIWKAGDISPAKARWSAVKANMNFLQAQVQKSGGIAKVPESYGDWCPPPQTVGHGQGSKPSKGFAAGFSI